MSAQEIACQYHQNESKHKNTISNINLIVKPSFPVEAVCVNNIFVHGAIILSLEISAKTNKSESHSSKRYTSN